jgi:hypothetical protein
MIAHYHVVEFGNVVERFRVQYERAGLTAQQLLRECDAMAIARLSGDHRDFNGAERVLFSVNDDGCPIRTVAKLLVY